MPELVHESHDVVRGYVVSVQTVYDPQRKHVYTHTTVEVLEDLRTGVKVPRLIVVRQLGGAVDGLETIITGNAKLSLGDEVVVFARTDGAFHYVIGMSQGKYSVARTPGKAAQLQRSLNGIHAFKRSGIALPQAPNTLSLDALRTQVKTLVKQEVRP